MEEDTLQELYGVELDWSEVLPECIVNWLEIFSKSHNVVKEIMFPGILTAISGLMAPNTTLKISPIELEPSNLFIVVLAPPGAGKSAALHAGVENPITTLEESIDHPILMEDFTRTGVFMHLKTTEGQGIFAKDEVHIILEKLCGQTRERDIDKDLFIKFFDNAQWTVNKGNSAKRERVRKTGMAFFGLSQPNSFYTIYSKLSKKRNGLIDRILCCCPKPLRMGREEVNASVERLQQCPLQNLEKVYERIYHRHNSDTNLQYTLSDDAFRFFLEKEQELVDLQNSIFSGKSTEENPQNISKASKLVLRLSVVLHVTINYLARAINSGYQLYTGDIPTIIEKRTVKGAVHLANWFQD